MAGVSSDSLWMSSSSMWSPGIAYQPMEAQSLMEFPDVCSFNWCHDLLPNSSSSSSNISPNDSNSCVVLDDFSLPDWNQPLIIKGMEGNTNPNDSLKFLYSMRDQNGSCDNGKEERDWDNNLNNMSMSTTNSVNVGVFPQFLPKSNILAEFETGSSGNFMDGFVSNESFRPLDIETLKQELSSDSSDSASENPHLCNDLFLDSFIAQGSQYTNDHALSSTLMPKPSHTSVMEIDNTSSGSTPLLPQLLQQSKQRSKTSKGPSLEPQGQKDTGNNNTIESCTSPESPFKRPRLESSITTGTATFKVRKEKLGDRITALQQLVSPFGKTDTASVLLEAVSYIKYLHEQVQVLSSPCPRRGSNNQHQMDHKISEKQAHDLKSRGLCLVPVSCTLNIAAAADPCGTDFWSSSLGCNLNFFA